MQDFHVIVGLGISGLSCARYLKSLNIPFGVVDTRAEPPHLKKLKEITDDVPIVCGLLDRRLLESASTLVVSPGISIKTPAIADQLKRGAKVIGDIELFAQSANADVIAITGTNAKSTVTTLVGLMTKAAGLNTALGGNLGIPALDLLQHTLKPDVYVLEVSSFQLETTHSLKANVASFLNLSPDHMDRYATLNDYQQAKLRIFNGCKVGVINRDDPMTACPHPLNKHLKFTLQAPAMDEFGLRTSQGRTYLAFEDQLLLETADLPVTGKHYQANALAALAIGYAYGLTFSPMLEVLKSFKGLPHRCELVSERNGIKWFNDSKGTNVGATMAAIEGLGSETKGKLVLIAGGLGKNADFTPLNPIIKQYVRHVVLIGEAAHILADTIGETAPTSFAASMEEAVWQADQHAHRGDNVLLSPACASFDMFKNFEHRGDVFRTWVQQLDSSGQTD